jgi:hypothetical protein
MAFVQSPTINPLSTGSMTAGGIQNNWDAIMEDFDAVAYLPFGDEYFDAMNQIMNAVGNREIAKQPRVRWFEMTRMELPIQQTAAAATVAGGLITVTLTTASATTVGGQPYMWPAVGDIWKNARSGQLFQVDSTAPVASPGNSTIVLRPMDSAALAAPATACPANSYFYYVGNSAIENSAPFASKFTFDTVNTTFLQTFRNDTRSSSEALYNQLWYSQLENGVQTPYSNSRDIIYLQREHQVALVNTFFAGVPTGSANYNLPSTTSFQTTQGLYDAIQNNGSGTNGGSNTVISVSAATPGATFDIEDFYAMEAALTSQDGSVKNYMVWTSGFLQAALERAIFSGTGNSAAQNPLNYNISVNKIQMEKTFWGEGAYADLMSRTFSFNNLVFNNKNFAFVRMGIFDNPTMFGVGSNLAGQTDNTWKNLAFFIPLSTNGGVDDGIGNMGKYIRVCHKPGAFMNMWQTGGRAASNKTPNWELGVHIVSEVGYKFVNANKYGMFTA